jgi:signal transduction histidine kinase
LARKNAGPEIQAPLDRIEREAARLNDLIGNLLTLAKWENGAAHVNQVHVELDELLEEVAADADFEARARNRSVRVLAVEPCCIAGVRELLRAAMENVVRNAVHYTNPGSEVELSLERVQDDAVIRVRDHGAGVPEEALERIFRPFYRVADARERSSGGSGLGLSITEKAVRLHGGRVKARNCPGGGLLVELQFPLHANSADMRAGFFAGKLDKRQHMNQEADVISNHSRFPDRGTR